MVISYICNVILILAEKLIRDIIQTLLHAQQSFGPMFTKIPLGDTRFESTQLNDHRGGWWRMSEASLLSVDKHIVS